MGSVNGHTFVVCSHHFRHCRPSSAQKGCLFAGEDLAAENRDLPYSVTGTFGSSSDGSGERLPVFFPTTETGSFED